jgi:hypothetical protein
MYDWSVFVMVKVKKTDKRVQIIRYEFCQQTEGVKRIQES